MKELKLFTKDPENNKTYKVSIIHTLRFEMTLDVVSIGMYFTQVAGPVKISKKITKTF